MSKDNQSYEYAKKVYEAKLKKRGADDPGTKEWKAKMLILSPEQGKAGEGIRGDQNDRGANAVRKSEALRKAMEKDRKKKEDDEEVVFPVNIHGSY